MWTRTFRSLAIVDSRDLMLAIVGAVACAWVVLLAIALWTHHWIIDSRTAPLVTDYLEVWVAGKSALKGAATAAYDPYIHHAAQVAVVGHGFKGSLGWHYPPLFLFAAATLALFP